MNLKPETLARIDEVIPHYPSKRSATLPLLHLIQEDVGSFEFFGLNFQAIAGIGNFGAQGGEDVEVGVESTPADPVTAGAGQGDGAGAGQQRTGQGD